MFLNILLQPFGHGHNAVVLLEQRQHRDLDRRQIFIEPHDHSGLFLDRLFVIRIDEKRQSRAIHAARRLNDIRIKFFVGDLVLIHQFLAGELGVLFKIIIRAVGNTFQFRPAERKQIFHVGTAGGVMRQLILGVLTQTQTVLTQAHIQIPLVPRPDPFFVTFWRLRGQAKIFDFHLLEFTRAESKIAGGDFVAERFADLGDAKRKFTVGAVNDILKVDEYALRGFGTHINHVTGALHRA